MRFFGSEVGALPRGIPVPSPSPRDETKKVKDDSQLPNNSKNVNPAPLNSNLTVPASPPSQSGTTKKEDDKPSTENVTSDTCDGLVKECTGLKNVVACTKSSDKVTGNWIILVQNQGESSLKANISVEGTLKKLNIPKQHSERINISLSSGKKSKIIINAANGECVLQIGSSAFEWTGMRLPSYEQLVTPINGAYLLIFSVLIFGATWACCKFRKRRWEDGRGVPYQELEMGMAETVSGTDLETAEGWDQGWDDDWDEDKADKSPGGHVGSISANGLTSRSTNKDGWENDWDG
ncbi:hypothetical protein FNV43_RR08659 [Rhamnella rubrinervis]|uniref:DUF7356 domain-containing protein n=1 Tax=Rhamnella rubrinervis TaxID=2594499 RepID=A0A8K0MJA1_9ROSA|nr:hypothetical protein FNV43_RR08659 [Rhamnella rubrinervis]